MKISDYLEIEIDVGNVWLPVDATCTRFTQSNGNAKKLMTVRQVLRHRDMIVDKIEKLSANLEEIDAALDEGASVIGIAE